MTRISEVADFLESVAPLHLQESYDNSGLLIGSPIAEVKGVLVSLDVTEEIIEEAIRKECNLVVSHHPAIFYGMKKITGQNLTERIVTAAIKNDVAIYAIHTNLDNVLSNGVNERIAKHLGLEVLGVLDRKETGLENTGAGLLATFQEPVREVEFLQLLKERMQSEAIRHTALLDRPIGRVAICGGSGSFLLKQAKKAGAHAFVTADYKYHQFFDADGEILICDIGHYESEQYTTHLLQELISRNFTTFAAHCTDINTNPVHYFT